MKTVNVQYGGFSTEQQVEENLYEVIYQQGREDALNELFEALSIFNDKEHGNEHFLYGIETCKEIIESMKGENNE